MKFKIGLLGIVALAVAACGGVKKDNRVTVIDGFAQGGTYHIVIKSDRPVDLKGQVDSLLREIDNSMSLFNPDSRLSRLNRNETDSVDAFIAGCIAEAERLSRETASVLNRSRVDNVSVATDEDYVKALIKLFNRR